MGLFSSLGKVAGVVAPLIPDAGIAAAVSGLGQMYTNQQQIGLANTSYQRQVADMKKAGINPIMAGIKGNGAAVPDIQNPALTGMNTKTAAKQLALNERDVESRISLNNSTAEKQRAEQKLIEQKAVSEMLNQDLIRSQTELNESQLNQINTYVNEHMPVILDKMREEISKIRDERERIRVMNALDETTIWEKRQMVAIAAAHVAIAQQNADSNRISANALADSASAAKTSADAAMKDAKGREDSGYWSKQAGKSSADTTNTNVDTVRDLIDIGETVIRYIPMRR